MTLLNKENEKQFEDLTVASIILVVDAADNLYTSIVSLDDSEESFFRLRESLTLYEMRRTEIAQAMQKHMQDLGIALDSESNHKT